MIRHILTAPAPQLRAVCDPVNRFDGALGALAFDMLETLYDAKGRGLAAPQIGEVQRLFVMDATWKEGAPRPMVFVNPTLQEVAESVAEAEEQCLSIPDTPVMVTRPVWVHLRWQGLDGIWQTARFEGFSALCIQHELDHLDGILITDKVAA